MRTRMMAALAALLGSTAMAGGAMAATPTLSGTYTLDYEAHCQAVLGGSKAYNGNITHIYGTAVFSAGGKVTLNETWDDGSLLDQGNGVLFQQDSEQPMPPIPATYSFDGSTLQLGNLGSFNASAGALTAGGVAKTVVFGSVSGNGPYANSCVENGHLIQ